MIENILKNNQLISAAGVFIILGTAFIFSSNKKNINVNQVLTALFVQVLTAFFILKTSIGEKIFESISTGFTFLYKSADAGSSFVFGNLTNANSPWGIIFVVKVIPIIIFFAALISLFRHLGIVNFFVSIVSKLIQPLLKTSGPETLCAAANSMLSYTDSPLIIKEYLKKCLNQKCFWL
jgi:CNT family concentrative nucleoside transporter